MAFLEWNIKKGDLVKITPSNDFETISYGIVMSEKPCVEQISLFPVVRVFSLASGCAREYYPYNLEIVSNIP